jgi:hypothetical protein
MIDVVQVFHHSLPEFSACLSYVLFSVFRQLVRYISPLVAQVKRPFKLTVWLLWVKVKVFVLCMYGQTMQGLLHGCMPVSFLLGCVLVGNFALQSTLLRFGGCLYATMGGNWNIFSI